jgi:hypothetical protein
MPPKTLRRCTICKRFHASYLVFDPKLGKGYYCYDCWQARYATEPSPTPDPTTSPSAQEENDTSAPAPPSE